MTKAHLRVTCHGVPYPRKKYDWTAYYCLFSFTKQESQHLLHKMWTFSVIVSTINLEPFFQFSMILFTADHKYPIHFAVAAIIAKEISKDFTIYSNFFILIVSMLLFLMFVRLHICKLILFIYF